MNKKTIFVSTIVALLTLFTACDTADSKSEWSGAKAMVRVNIAVAGTQTRTVTPTVVLQDVTLWRLFGGKQGEPQTELATFTNAEGTTVLLESATWDFILNGYKGDDLILASITEQAISSTGTNVLNFTVKPVLEGEGTLKITVELPADSGITAARVFKDGTEFGSAITPVGGKIVFEESFDAGTYYFSIRLYKDDVLYGAVSEVVHIRANLQSEKTYNLTLEDLKLTYTITYHLEDGEIETAHYKYTDATITLPTPSQPDYIFKGWYESPEFSGNAVVTIPAGSRGDRDFYAKKIASVQTPSNSSLAESLAWISSNAEEGGAYTITVNAAEAITPTTLSYNGKKIDIMLNGGTAKRTISLSSNGSLFTVGDGVTLTLGNNVTLQGRSDNHSSLVYVNSGGTLILRDGGEISGNTVSSSGGGVYVNGGAFTMSGGEISGNTAAYSGGGVYVSGGTFTMSGGEISGNTVSSSSSSSYGGGVYVYSSGAFTMSGGEISGNTAASSGGGVYVSGGTFTMSGGEISGNTVSSSSSSSYGGGVYVYSSGTFTMSGGTISGNTAAYSPYNSSYGGGVYVYSSGTFTMSGGTISGNTATAYSSYHSSYGGGVYSAGTFTKQGGGVIYGSNASSSLKNTAGNDSNGHAVYANGKKRNTTANASVNLDSSVSGSAGGWE